MGEVMLGVALGLILGWVLGWICGRVVGLSEGAFRERCRREETAISPAVLTRGRRGVDLDADSMAGLVDPLSPWVRRASGEQVRRSAGAHGLTGYVADSTTGVSGVGGASSVGGAW